MNKLTSELTDEVTELSIDESADDRRLKPRFDFAGKVRTRVTEINLDSAAEYNHDLECAAVDASAHGIQFSSELALSAGIILDVTVEDPHTHKTYQLTGEVRWVSGQHAGPGFLVGMQLFDWLETDIGEWQEQFLAA